LSTVVGRASRAIDAASLVLIVAGAALYLWSYVGMGELRLRAAGASFQPGTTEAFASMREWARLHRMSWAGVGLAVIGIGVGVYAAMHAKRRRRL
jgi:hypothetical protein